MCNINTKIKPLKLIYVLVLLFCGTTSYSQSGWQVQTIGKSLASVYFINSATGFAAGDNGVIFKTTNSAQSWEFNDTKAGVSLTCIYFPSASTGFAAGNAGYIVRTTNAGINWAQVPSGTTNRLNSVFFADDNTGWAVGQSGRIIKTVNAGGSWFTQNSGVVNQINSVYFSSASNGIAVGIDGILRTSDGGSNWSLNTQLTGNLNSVVMVNSTTGYLANLSSSIYKTTNGGINWFAQPTGTSLSCYSIAFTSINDLWATSVEGSIIRTTNAGANWTVQYSSSSNELYSINLKSGFGCAVGNNGTITVTTNSGTNWILNIRGTENETISDIFFINQQTGWIAGWQGIIYSSTTGGRIWNKQISNTTAQLNSVCFISAQTGFAAGNSGILVTTTNGGASWVSSGIAIENLKKIRFINSATGFICGDNGTLLRTTNTGLSWNQVSSGTTFNVQDISFSGTSTGYSVTSFNPTVLKSTNGGLSWTPLTLSVNGAYSVSFVNDNTGYVKSALVNNLVKTTNGGLSWNNITDPGGFYARFRNPNLGWSAGGTLGDSLLIAGTGNGGQSWNRYTSKIINSILEIFMLSDSVGWCVSNSGFVLKTTNGGGTLTGIQHYSNSLPEKFMLWQNYPNPFNPVTNIEFAVAKSSAVKIAVYDMLGREVEILVNRELKPGSYKTDWDASNYPSGVYFYKLVTRDFSQTKKMILVK